MRRVFESVVRTCSDHGLVGGTGALIDGSTVFADANRDRRDTPDAFMHSWSEKDVVLRPVQAFLDQLQNAAPQSNEGPQHKPPKYISETDPQAAWSLKDGPGRFSYEVNYLADDKHAIIMDVEATPARLSQEIVAAKAMLERCPRMLDLIHLQSLRTKAMARGLSSLGCSSVRSPLSFLFLIGRNRQMAN